MPSTAPSTAYKQNKKRKPSAVSGQEDRKRSLSRSFRKKKKQNKTVVSEKTYIEIDKAGVHWRSRKEQAEWLGTRFRNAYGPKLSALELDTTISEDKLVQLSDEKDRSTECLSWHVKNFIGPTWKEALCGEATDISTRAKKDLGSPVLLVLCSSAVRCVELLRGLREFTTRVKPVKLFAKHIKLQEQVTSLETNVNIAAGTPNRVRKLADIGALGLDELSIVLLDMHCDSKGLTLFSVPEVMVDFWELYKTHLHQRVLNNQLKLCLY